MCLFKALISFLWGLLAERVEKLKHIIDEALLQPFGFLIVSVTDWLL